jgi:hypothetical protein
VAAHDEQEQESDSDAELPLLVHRRNATDLSSDEESKEEGGRASVPPPLGCSGSVWDLSSDEESEDNNDMVEQKASVWSGLQPPSLSMGEPIDGHNKQQLRHQNKQARQQKQVHQHESTYWSTHQGQFEIPPKLDHLGQWRGEMCPKGLALHHPVAGKLLQYATKGCPSRTGKPWTRAKMQEAIDRGPHISALVPEMMAQLAEEIDEKRIGQCRVFLWVDIKDNPPEQLKISPLAMSKPFRVVVEADEWWDFAIRE